VSGQERAQDFVIGLLTMGFESSKVNKMKQVK